MGNFSSKKDAACKVEKMASLRFKKLKAKWGKIMKNEPKIEKDKINFSICMSQIGDKIT